MCGIAGFSGECDADLLASMNRLQEHRGPDDEGLWMDRSQQVGLAHRRLSILDLSAAGRQPMFDVDRRACVVYNGEIYNYRTLRDELVAEGCQFKSQTDTEVLLQLYLKYGHDFLNKLNGIFAFAIWDSAQRELFLARDHFGVKPLYYAQTENCFLFASELKALLCDGRIDRSIDAQAAWNHIHYLWSPAPVTMLKGVKKFAPGQAMVVRESRVCKSWTYEAYSLNDPVLDSNTSTEAEMCESVRRSIRSAVQRQMVADVPIGAFLSGGLDSSSVVAFAREFTNERLQCFSIELTELNGAVDDLPYAKRVASHLDVDLHVVTVGPEITDSLERMIYHMDEPQADPAPLNALLISELARSHGIKVLLSGAGGDDIFTGYRRHYALMQEKYWGWLPRGIRMGLRQGTSMFPQGFLPFRQLAKAFSHADRSADERLVGYFHWIHRNIGSELLSQHMQQSLVGSVEPLMQTLQLLPQDTSRLQKMLQLEVQHFLCDHNLNYTDKMSMAAGVEARVPLLDPDLVRLAFSLPDNVKQRGRTGKWIFKKAMEGILPDQVIYRPKTGFGAPLRRWLHHEWRDLLEDTLSARSINARGLFDAQRVAGLVKQDRAGRIDASYTIFALVCMELWCRRFLDETNRG